MSNFCRDCRLVDCVCDGARIAEERDEALQRVVALEEEVERLEEIEKAARRVYEMQRGTMSMLSPSGLALKKALGAE